MHAFSGLSTNSNNHIMPHIIINDTNKHSWAGFKSTICSPTELQTCPLYKSAAEYRERGITDKTIVINDRVRGRNYPSRQVGKKIYSVNSFRDPTLVSIRNLNTYIARHNDKKQFCSQCTNK